MILLVYSFNCTYASDDLNNENTYLNDDLTLSEDDKYLKEDFFIDLNDGELIVLYNDSTNNTFNDSWVDRSNRHSYSFDSWSISNNITTNYSESFSLPFTFIFKHLDSQFNTMGGESHSYDDETYAKVYIDNISILNTTINGGISRSGRVIYNNSLITSYMEKNLGEFSKNHTLVINTNEKINVGKHDIKIILSKKITTCVAIRYYRPNEFYVNSEFHCNLTVKKSNMYLTINNTYSKEKHVAPITIHINNNERKNISGISLDIFKNDEYIGSAYSDENGNAILYHRIPEDANGTYNISVFLKDNLNCFDTNISSKLIISDIIHTKFISKNMTMYFHDGSNFTAQLTELDETAISNKMVIMEVNGINYTRISDEQGFVSLKINLYGGIYKIKLYHLTSNNYLSCTSISYIKIKSSIQSENLLKNYRDDYNQFYAKFYDKNENIMQNMTVVLTINGIKYERETDFWGFADLNINLLPGTYLISLFNPITGECAQNSVTVKDSVIINSYDLVKYYGEDKYFEFYIYDENYEQYYSEHLYNVSFNINGKFYELTSYNNFIELNFGLIPGEYIITADYRGYKKSNKITVLPPNQTLIYDD